MLNFNNKKVKEHFPVEDQNKDPDASDKQIYMSKERRQQTPTQCLLFISEMQNSEKHNHNYQSHQIQSVEVTPWVNMPFRIKKQRNQSKSKTSMLLSSCDDCRNIVNNEKRQKQNRVSFTKKESRKQIKLIHKNTDSIKNIQSAIASYSERTNQQPSHDYSNKNLRNNVLQLKTNNSSHQVSKVSANGHKSKNKDSSKNKNMRYNNENDSQIGHLSILEMEKFEENLKGMKNFMNSTSGYKNSTTHSILRQNTAIVNDAKGVSLFSCVDSNQKQDINNRQGFENVQKFQKQSQLRKKTEQSTTKQKERELSIFRKAQFQNILTDAQKKTSEYHKIKNKILESIKKQAMVRQGTKMDINKSKKMLGRYFKQIQQKKPKNKIKTHLNFSSSAQKTDSSDLGFEYTNPLAKQLYDKYKLFLSKGK